MGGQNILLESPLISATISKKKKGEKGKERNRNIYLRS
jgi:hypothetical protein